MSTAIKRSYFLDHEKGTKFYEVVSIWLEERKVGVLIKRWGKIMYAKRIGGQVKKEYFTNHGELVRAENDILADKRKGNKNGKYSDTASMHGIHGVNGAGVDEDVLAKAIVAHYGSNEGSDICAQLGASVTGREEAVVDESELDEVAPEPERTGDWGSW